MMSFAANYLEEVKQVVAGFDPKVIEDAVALLDKVRSRGGRLFILGVGGSAANASHAVNDFRKICGFECYTPTDNVSELTARTNDEGWQTIFVEWLIGSRLSNNDAILVFSVGGGDTKRNVSPNLVAALDFAKEVGAAIVGIVGRDGGYTARQADVCIIVPTVNNDRVTPHSEAFQAVIWHLIVSHPKLKRVATKWESVAMKTNSRRPAVFLDRDGVINRAIVRNGQPFSPSSVGEVALLPDVNEACELLKKNGFHLVVVTNQPEVTRGTVDQKNVEKIHQRISESLPIDRIEVCYDCDDSSEFRKPNPGMLKRAARELDVDLECSFMVGDRWRDVDCGHAAGCQTIFIDHGYAERLRKTPHYRAKNLLEAAQLIVDLAAVNPKE